MDLNPLDPVRDADRLFSYLWPDQPERLSFTEAAIGVAQAAPARIARGDATDWLSEALADRREGEAHVVFHTVAWQYFPASVQARCAALLEGAGVGATETAPLAHFSMEAEDGRGAALRLQVWPRGDRLALGRADFHGRWIEWSTACLAP